MNWLTLISSQLAQLLSLPPYSLQVPSSRCLSPLRSLFQQLLPTYIQYHLFLSTPWYAVLVYFIMLRGSSKSISLKPWRNSTFNFIIVHLIQVTCSNFTTVENYRRYRREDANESNSEIIMQNENDNARNGLRLSWESFEIFLDQVIVHWRFLQHVTHSPTHSSLSEKIGDNNNYLLCREEIYIDVLSSFRHF